MRRFRRFLLQHAGGVVGGLVLVWVGSIVFGMFTGLRPRGWWFGSLAVLVTVLFALLTWARWQREVAIRESALPQFLKRKLRETYPQLDGRDCDLVERGFRQFFLACLRSQKEFVAMPSKVVDQFWHEFILHTRAYRDWCDLTLGRFLHHTPAEVLGPRVNANDGLRRAWRWSCREESIDLRRPTRLPLLFALDGKLGIAGGFRYVADCTRLPGNGPARTAADGGSAVHCATSFGAVAAGAAGSAEIDGGDFAGFGVDAGSDGGDASSSCGGDGGSCGGGGD